MLRSLRLTVLLPIVLLIVGALAPQAYAQVGIGTTTPNANSILELTATDKGFLPPRLDRTSVTATAAEEGMLVYDNIAGQLYVWNGASWQPLATGGSTPWNTNVNGIDYTAGNVGIGMALPDEKLVVVENGGQAVSRVVTTNAGGGTNPGMLQLANVRGTYAAPSASVAFDDLGRIEFLGTNTALVVNPAAAIEASVESAASDRVTGFLTFSTTPNTGSTTPVERMIIRENGNVGIGLANPAYQLQVADAIGASDVYAEAMHTRAEGTASFNDFVTYTNGTDAYSYMVMVQANGTEAIPTATQASDTLGAFAFGGYDGSGFEPASFILSTAAGNYSATNLGSELSFYTTPTGATDADLVMNLSETGNVGIGSVLVPTAKLQVDGDLLLANGTNVDDIIPDGSGTYPTFTDDQLLTAAAVEDYVATNSGFSPWVDIGGGNIGYPGGNVEILNRLFVGTAGPSDPNDAATFQTAATESSVSILNTTPNGQSRLVLNAVSGSTENYVRYTNSSGSWSSGVTATNHFAIAEGARPGINPWLQVYPGGDVKIGGGSPPTAQLGVNGDIALQTGTSVNTIVDLATAQGFTVDTDLTDDQLLTGLAIGELISDSLASVGRLTHFTESFAAT